ncbi:FixH family protein [Erythrobacter insulae]|uniref:FixH family protein n=1 Tax=Erythrobacter insulae TaxID=2584124 RepID=A0A547PA05_9SPHN|nr:FixH family protein [Erythrobacter insulae]TRD10874.1 FixH family protein [Erythrobacter insulae]
MSGTRKKFEFTGRHMAGVLVGGFGIVVAVNFYMASLATGGFHGVVVENSYVASQEFNDWLDEAEASRALGWEADAARDGTGHVIVETDAIPAGATMTAELRRPIGLKEFAALEFVRDAGGTYRSTRPVKPGRWTIRLSIASGDLKWAGESELP